MIFCGSSYRVKSEPALASCVPVNVSLVLRFQKFTGDQRRKRELHEHCHPVGGLSLSVSVTGQCLGEITYTATNGIAR